MTSSKDQTTVREAVGIFFDAEHLKGAMDELLALGFRYEELGLLASEHAVRQKLADFYTRTNALPDSPKAPVTAFVRKESVGDTAQALGGSLFFAGTTGAMGAVVASAAVLGGSLLAAVGGAVAVGAVGAVVGAVIHQSDAEYLQEQVDKGHLLLFVRLIDPARDQQALNVLSRHAGTDVKIYEIPVASGRPDRPS